MPARPNAYQIQQPLLLGNYLQDRCASTLRDIAHSLKNCTVQELRSHRRALVQTLRYVRTHGVQHTADEWTAFAQTLSAMPMCWDEALGGRYRYRIPCRDLLPPQALTIFLKESLDSPPAGWHSSQQTREHYHYAMKTLPKDFTAFVPDSAWVDHGNTSRQSMFSLLFPAPHSAFVQELALGRADTLAHGFWPQKQPTLSTNNKWLQGAFALARCAENVPAQLAQGMCAPSWFQPQCSLVKDRGLALSFFEIIGRLPQEAGRPQWMPEGFNKMLVHEKDIALIERGWNAVNFSEDERLTLILGLAKDCPTLSMPLDDILHHDWTTPIEERKALALQAFQDFGNNQTDETPSALIQKASEWIALLVPEVKPWLDLCCSGGPAQVVVQLEQCLAPTNTNALELPSTFDDSAQMSDGLAR